MRLELDKLFFNTSKIQFESKSQPTIGAAQICKCCFSIRQRYNLKANHNLKGSMPASNVLFFNTSKIQFESKSQLKNLMQMYSYSCFSIRQRYNLKANHNSIAGCITNCRRYATCFS